MNKISELPRPKMIRHFEVGASCDETEGDSSLAKVEEKKIWN